jgi:hypothetical protein
MVVRGTEAGLPRFGLGDGFENTQRERLLRPQQVGLSDHLARRGRCQVRTTYRAVGKRGGTRP